MKRFFTHWITVTIALGVAVWVVPGIGVDSFPVLLVAALVLGFVNAIVRPILLILTLPITVLTLGLFYFVINGFAFYLAAQLVPGFHVASFGSAIVGSLVVGLVSWFVGMFGRPERSYRDR